MIEPGPDLATPRRTPATGGPAVTAAALTAARDRLVRHPAQHREGRATRAPVDLEIVVPAHGAAARLPAVLTATAAFLATLPHTSRLVVVDAAAAGDTATRVPAPSADPARGGAGRVEVVVVGCSRTGRGPAVHRGLRTSRSRIVGFTDPGSSAPPEVLLPALAALDAGAAAAIASRYAPGADPDRRPSRRLTDPGLADTVLRLLSRPLLPGVRDPRGGSAFFDRATVQSALWRCRSTGPALEVELLRLVRADGGRIAEVPVGPTAPAAPITPDPSTARRAR